MTFRKNDKWWFIVRIPEKEFFKSIDNSLSQIKEGKVKDAYEAFNEYDCNENVNASFAKALEDDIFVVKTNLETDKYMKELRENERI